MVLSQLSERLFEVVEKACRSWVATCSCHLAHSLDLVIEELDLLFESVDLIFEAMQARLEGVDLIDQLLVVCLNDLISLELDVTHSFDLIVHILQLLLLDSNPLDQRSEGILGHKGVLNLQDVEHVCLDLWIVLDRDFEIAKLLFQFGSLLAIGVPAFNVLVRQLRIARLESPSNIGLHDTHVVLHAINASDNALNRCDTADQAALYSLDHLLQLINGLLVNSSSTIAVASPGREHNGLILLHSFSLRHGTASASTVAQGINIGLQAKDALPVSLDQGSVLFVPLTLLLEDLLVVGDAALHGGYQVLEVLELGLLHELLEFLVSLGIDLVLHVVDGLQNQVDRVVSQGRIGHGCLQLVGILHLAETVVQTVDVMAR